jgi:hypothetical protein
MSDATVASLQVSAEVVEETKEHVAEVIKEPSK